MTGMEALFTVQSEDAAARRLQHRRETLPERALIVEADRAKAEILSRRVVVADERDELARRERRLEDEVASLEEKVRGEEDRLYKGSITSPKEAQTLQEEVASLKRRLDGLEDEALSLLVETDPLDELLAAFDEELAANDERVAAAKKTIAEAEAEIDQELASLASRRDGAVREVPADLLARYERLAPRYRESTLVRFGGGSCPGCPSAMPAMEVDRIKGLAAGEVTDCEECGRLVAT